MNESSPLQSFLRDNEVEILKITEQKITNLAGGKPSTPNLESALPVFFERLLKVLALGQVASTQKSVDKKRMVQAALDNDEPAMANATGRPYEADLALAAGEHGVEMLRLGYSLSHVIHAYGSICQAITELSTKKGSPITTSEFNDLNRCLDVAMAGAVTQYQAHKDIEIKDREVEHLGFLAHELRNALNSVNVSFMLIKRGTVGMNGSTGDVLERGLKRMEGLIDRSLTEVRLSADPKVLLQKLNLLIILDHILITAAEEAKVREQEITVDVDSSIEILVDQQLFYSGLNNLIQNALKYTHVGGKIQIRAKKAGPNVRIEVEDECGGLAAAGANLFKPFEQHNDNRIGLGLGLTIAKKAMELNQGTITVEDLPKRGCIFTIIIPYIA